MARDLAASRLAITCAACAPAPVLATLGPALVLEREGLAASDEIESAAAVAIGELGVRALVVIARTDCAHRGLVEPAVDPNRWILERGAIRTSARFVAARQELRETVRELHGSSRVRASRERPIPCFGLLYAAEAGVTHLYDPVLDTLEVIA